MKKFTILALAAIMTLSLLAGCRNPKADMDINPGNTGTPTGVATEPTTEHRENQPITTAPTTLPQTDPTTEGATTPTANNGNQAVPESRFGRRMPGM